jgi:molecular chaperone GrpE
MKHKRKKQSETDGPPDTNTKEHEAQSGGPVDPDKLLDMLLRQKDELFEETFLTEEDRKLLSILPMEHKESVRAALIGKGVLFKKLHGRLQRVSADYANFQKRVPKQISDTIGYEKERIIKTLLPVLDNFERMMQNAHSSENVDVLVKGIKIIYDQFLDILKSHNVERIEALGKRFDPVLHQAIRQQSDPEKEQNIVLEEFQKGYKLNEWVIRPSMVIVNKLPEEKPGDGQQAELPEQHKDERNAAGEYESTDTE